MSNDIKRKIIHRFDNLIIKNLNQPLTNSIESIDEINSKFYITLICSKDNLAEYQHLINQAKSILNHDGIEYEIILTNPTTVTTTTTKESTMNDKRKHIKKVNKLIMIASGKGGVGKSTIALNLAITLAKFGKKVGLIDADIYGPSLSSLTNINQKPQLINNLMIPHKKFGIELMSASFLINNSDALIWRGPMISKMLYQLMHLTDWAREYDHLDYLLIDMPPGTGDVYLSLAENYYIDGAIVISTPQSLSLADVNRTMTMLNKLNIQCLGIIENFSYLLNKEEEKNYIFGKNNLNRNLAKDFNTNLISKLPYDPYFNEQSQISKPLTYHDEKSVISILFKEIVKALVFN